MMFFARRRARPTWSRSRLLRISLLDVNLSGEGVELEELDEAADRSRGRIVGIASDDITSSPLKASRGGIFKRCAKATTASGTTRARRGAGGVLRRQVPRRSDRPRLGGAANVRWRDAAVLPPCVGAGAGSNFLFRLPPIVKGSVRRAV